MRASSSTAGWTVPSLAAVLVFLLGPHAHDAIVPEALHRASIAARSGLPASGLASLEAAIDFEPALAALHPQAVNLALRAGDVDAASRHIDAMQASLNSSEADCGTGDSLEEPVCFRRASLLSFLADRAWRAGDFESAYVLLSELASNEMGSVDDLRRRALAATVVDTAAAPTALRDALAALPSPDPLLADLAELTPPAGPDETAAYEASVGGIFASAGEWALARPALEAALDLQPKLAIARAYLGMAMERLGEDGFRQIWAAVLVDPSSSVTWTILGTYWLDRGFPDRAMPLLRHAQRLEPRNPAPVAAMGAALEDLGEIDAAADAYVLATELAPHRAEFWSLLASLSMERDHALTTIGLPAARNAAVLSDRDPAAVDLLGHAHALAGDPRLAVRLLRSAIEGNPQDARAHYHLGLTYLDLQDLEGASMALQASAALDPDGEVGRLAERVLELIPR